MAEHALVDNDVVIKVACYALVDETLAATTLARTPPAMLGVGRFVARGRLARDRRVRDRARALDALERLLSVVVPLEPEERETSLAAELEAGAIRLNVELDGGESQLIAMLMTRGCPLLVTGDKRAVAALAALAVAGLSGRVACLEQVLADVVRVRGADAVRAAVCSEPGADTALSLCFGCSSAKPPNEPAVLDALSSYAEHLRGRCGDILLAGPDLAAVAPRRD